jgi:glycosyltransferase involved in cell wall biosynthesis
MLSQYAEVAVNPRGQSDIDLYHLGNNHLHRLIYSRALERPGVIVLHDAVLQHFFLGWLDESAYVEEFVYNYGEWSRDLARSLWLNRARCAQDPRYFRYPMLRRVAERSRAVVVHNPAAAAAVRRHAPGACIHEIPHLFLRPELPPAYESIRLRSALDLPRGSVLFGVFGYLRESKRLFTILRALKRLRTSNIRLLVAGTFSSAGFESAVRPLLRRAGVLLTGYLPEREFWLYASAVDVCLNLRYPAAGETSGIAIRLMGIGKPTILSAGEETARIPEPACVKVDHGLAEEVMLQHFMTLLAESSAVRHGIGHRASAHIGVEHNAARCAPMYWEVLGGQTGRD